MCFTVCDRRETKRESRGEVGGRDCGRPGDDIMDGVDKLYAGRGHDLSHWRGIILYSVQTLG